MKKPGKKAKQLTKAKLKKPVKRDMPAATQKKASSPKKSSTPDSNSKLAVDKIKRTEAAELKKIKAYNHRLTSQLEKQNRELEIEAALEKVRSRSLAMHKSDELWEVVTVVFEKFQELNFSIDGAAFIGTFIEGSGFFNCWLAGDQGQPYPTILKMPYYDSPSINDIWQAKESGVDFFSKTYSFEEKNHWLSYAFENTGLKIIADEFKNWILEQPCLTQPLAFGKNSFIGIHFHHQKTLSEAEVDILKRFSKVFDQAYIRFLDLQNAEAQARESQIQLSLERVRARAMSMYHSDEISDVLSVLFEQFDILGISPMYTFLSLIDVKNNNFLYRQTGRGGKRVIAEQLIDMSAMDVWKDVVDRWKASNYDVVETMYVPKELVTGVFEIYKEIYAALPEGAKVYPEDFPDGMHATIAASRFGHLGYDHFRPSTEEEKSILLRFNTEFIRLYQRFLDLQKAEAQARESQIQLALERVRARTMAMHHSSELADTATILFQQIKELGFEIWSCGFGIWKPEVDMEEAWMSTGDLFPIILLPFKEDPSHLGIYEASQRGESVYEVEVKGEILTKHYVWLMSQPSFKTVFGQIENSGIILPTVQYKYAAFFKQGYLHLITTKPQPDIHNINQRFAKVFEQTYTRFLDLQKAEAQARESQIQLAMERVRARTMAMQRSEELPEVAALLFQQVKALGVPQFQCGFNIFEIDDKECIWYPGSADGDILPPCKIPLTEHPIFMAFNESRKRGDELYVYEKEGEYQAGHYRYMLSLPVLGEMLQNMLDAGIPFPTFQIDHIANFSHGNLLFITSEHFPEMHDTFKRFAKVFEQTYTRFLDLQKAEAQAREAQIEVALERVRARAMAMQSSDELIHVANVMRVQMGLLGQSQIETLAIHLYEDDKPIFDSWYAFRPGRQTTGEIITGTAQFKKDSCELLREMIDGYKSENNEYTIEAIGSKLKEWTAVLAQAIPVITDNQDFIEKSYFYFTDFSGGSMVMVSYLPPTDETKSLQKRCTAVFDLAYRRFLDLKQAEAQAREAQIEASLERVRSKTMAMHNSNDVGESVAALFDELTALGVLTSLDRCGIGIMQPHEMMELWTAEKTTGKTALTIGHLDMQHHRLLRNVYQNWLDKKETYQYILEGEDKLHYYEAIRNQANYKIKKDYYSAYEKIVHTDFFFKEGCLYVFSLNEFTTEASSIFIRFANVFGQTYRRYLDLQIAEANAREATIEAALEKVRGKAMAMHNSNDLVATAGEVFSELRKLGIKPIRCGVGLLNGDSKTASLYNSVSTEQGDEFLYVGKAPLEGHSVISEIYDSASRGEPSFPVLKGELLRSYYEKVLSGSPIPDLQPDYAEYGYFLSFNVGFFYGWSVKPIGEQEIKILNRFKTIIDLTFRRYIELQKAEANALEAIRSASLDRVRAEIASMRTISDLDRIQPLLWNELKTLGVPFIRCGMFIMDEEKQEVQTFLSTPDGKSIAAFHLPYYSTQQSKQIVTHWQQKQLHKDHMDEAAFAEYTKNLVQQGAVASDEKYVTENRPTDLYLHFLPFLQGMLYVGNDGPLKEEELQLVQNLADAFATAYARYEDFNKLEAAKKQVDSTLNELQATQKQLIQSEKMASLGELTAGIAHEIQNPLNFVNNFSEVSTELVAEMNAEIDKGNSEEAKEIANDLKQNLEKINHHGKRAADIVKGMLQHSRNSSGAKEPTDMNALADEYLRLAYHGLRAKDKSFNATLNTDYDETIGSINIISQDIGRVILNLINNAFYAVAEKKKQVGDGFDPTVSVSTKKDGNKVLISVKDNGNGIPQKVLDKIFQPFFTTKPTGQGTGLGLSLSYDIVKAHGGEIQVTTKENEGTTFVIELPIN